MKYVRSGLFSRLTINFEGVVVKNLYSLVNSKYAKF